MSNRVCTYDGTFYFSGITIPMEDNQYDLSGWIAKENLKGNVPSIYTNKEYGSLEKLSPIPTNPK